MIDEPWLSVPYLITFIRRIVFGRPQEEEFQVALHIHLHHEQGVRTQ